MAYLVIPPKDKYQGVFIVDGGNYERGLFSLVRVDRLRPVDENRYKFTFKKKGSKQKFVCQPFLTSVDTAPECLIDGVSKKPPKELFWFCHPETKTIVQGVSDYSK